MIDSVLNLLFRCPHRRLTRPVAPLTKPGEPWFGSAGEMTALALAKQGKRQEAGQLFATIAKDNAAPSALRGRAAVLTQT